MSDVPAAMERDDLLMQTIGVTIELVRNRHDVAVQNGPQGPGCGASLYVWSDVLAHLEAAERYYNATQTVREWCAQVADQEERDCQQMRDARPRDSYHWSFWERARKTAAVIAGTIRALPQTEAKVKE